MATTWYDVYDNEGRRVCGGKDATLASPSRRSDARRSGYCEHGVYVGGCGPDYMCGYCEDGISWEDYCEMWEHRNIRRDATMFAIVMLSLTGKILDTETVKEVFDIVRGPVGKTVRVRVLEVMPA